eukprot:m.100418 g.100418  ORF g.100418 m.100418 type:complete len:181 (-) comp12553_c0_seq3:721-1263(-)
MESTVTKVVDIPLDGKIEPDSSVKIGTIQPDLKSICSHQSKDSVYLVRAMLKDLKSNSTLSERSILHPCSPDILDWDNTTFYITYCSQYANFSGLCSLGPTKLNLTLSDDGRFITIENVGGSIAFGVQLLFTKEDEEKVETTFSDNYMVIYPNERVEIRSSKPLISKDGISVDSFQNHCP